MAPRKTSKRSGRESPLGSHQSAEEVAQLAATQPALLAAAAKNKTKVATPIVKKSKATSGKKGKLLDLTSLVSPSGAGTSTSYRDNNKPVSKAVFSLIKAKYQKGDKKDQLSGSIYFRGKPRYGKNEIFKMKVGSVLLEEQLRWNDEIKLYTARVFNAKQADMVLEQMRMVSVEDEKDLADVEVDPDIFEDATPIEIKMFPIEIEGEMHDAVGGYTYPFKSVLKAAGFTFTNEVNGQGGVKLWVRVQSEAQPEVDMGDLEATFEHYGFPVETYDGIGEDDE